MSATSHQSVTCHEIGGSNPARVLHPEQLSDAAQHIIKIPTQSAKRLSPLDNALFHDFKEKVRKSCPLSLNMIEQTMITAWKKVTAKQIQGHYRNCGLMRRADAFADCSNPSVHQH